MGEEYAKEYKHKKYGDSISLENLLDDAWTQQSRPQPQPQPAQLLVPPALAKTAKEILEQGAADIFGRAFEESLGKKNEERSKVDTVMDKIISEL